MSWLDDYRIALLAIHSDVAVEELVTALDARGESFAGFIIDHGLGPVWHARTGKEVFRRIRMQAEALYGAQENALREITANLDAAGIEHVVFKGAATRLLLYANPAERACSDLDILVRYDDRAEAANRLTRMGFVARPNPASISRELLLTRADADVDLHWGLLREGRLRTEPTPDMLPRRRRVADIWALDAEDTLFTMLVHAAFAKHLAGWELGLHRVADLVLFLNSQAVDWNKVRARLEAHGVRSAAWAALRWVQLLAGRHAPKALPDMLGDLRPGVARRSWLDFWLRNNLPHRTSRAHWARLLGFSLILHDTVGDAVRAAKGRRNAARRRASDLNAFAELGGE